MCDCPKHTQTQNIVLKSDKTPVSPGLTYDNRLN
jgi:hypothetical protein